MSSLHYPSLEKKPPLHGTNGRRTQFPFIFASVSSAYLLRTAALAVVFTAPPDEPEPAGSAGDFQVSRGQFTFDAEIAKDSKHSSLKPSVPTDTSGVTLGAGYDLKKRKADEVIADLTAVGLPRQQAEKYAEAVGLKGAKARNFLADNTEERLAERARVLGLSDADSRDFIAANGLRELTPSQQKKLFELDYPRYEADVRRISADPERVKRYGRIDWERLDPAIRDMLVDLRYRGDYTPGSRELIQKLAAKNDLKGFAAVMQDCHSWKDLPDAVFDARRFTLRTRYLQQALEKKATAEKGGRQEAAPRLAFDESQPKGANYRDARKEKTLSIAAKLANEKRYKPDGETTYCSDFVRDFGRELLGYEISELKGQAKDQFDSLKNSPCVDKLWLPENGGDGLKKARAALEKARELSERVQRARKNGDQEEARKLAGEIAQAQKEARQQSQALGRAFQQAQNRANQGDLVIVAWKAQDPSLTDTGHVAIVVPSRGSDSELSESGDWGGLRVPHLAQAGRDVFDYSPLGFGFRSVETIEGLALFAVKAKSPK